MEFTADQKEIIRLIAQEKITNLESFITVYLPTKNISVNINSNVIDLKGDEILRYFKEFTQIWLFLEKNSFIKPEPSSLLERLDIFIKEKKDIEVYQHPALRRCLTPFQSLDIHLSFELQDYVDNGFRTAEELRYERENIARNKAQKLAMITAISSIILGVAGTLINLYYPGARNVRIIDSKPLYDTIKVITISPPVQEPTFVVDTLRVSKKRL